MSRNVAHPELASRPFDRERDGFVMGEGAGFVVMQRATDASATHRSVLGRVAGAASTADAYNLVAPSADGSGALACMRAALDDAGLGINDVSHINAHGTSTVSGDLSEALAVGALFPAGAPPMTSVKGTTGHLVGGSGAVEAIVTLRTLATGSVPHIAGLGRIDPQIDLDLVQSAPRAIRPGPALSNSFGFGGMNTALVLSPA
jgi:3-oxoacyl-[acyl-carrier-protein] synthase II